MELDKRIKKGKRPLNCFDTDIAKEYVGKECYFTSKLSNFENLSRIPKAILHNIDDSPIPFHCYGDGDVLCDDCYILPCEWVKEEPTPKHIDFEAAKKDSNFELCEMYGNELLFDTKNNIFYTSDGNVHTYLTVLAQRHYNEEQTKDVMIEKKYRPYTKDEFLNKFECGKPITIRHKDDHINVFIETLSSVRIDNYMDDVHIHLYEGIVDLERLFNEFEWQKSNGEWQPFGVLEE